MNKLNCLFLFAAFSLATSCKKEDDRRHEDILIATINGKEWKAGCEESALFGCKIADFQYYQSLGSFELAGGNVEGDTSIAIRLTDVFAKGDFKIPNTVRCAIIDKKGVCGRQGHYIMATDPQQIIITKIDLENKIMEGNFHFIGRDTLCKSEPVYVTNGYFKMKYRN